MYRYLSGEFSKPESAIQDDVSAREKMGTFHISMSSNQAAWRLFFPVESGYAVSGFENR
jgi:hypothetical protein